MVESVGGGPRLGRCPPPSCRGAIGRGLWTAPGRVAFALALGEAGHDPWIDTGLAESAFDMTDRGLLTDTDHVDSVRDPLLTGEVIVTALDPPRRSRDRSRSLVRSPPSSDRTRSKEGGQGARREMQESVETVTVSQAPAISEVPTAIVPPVGGATIVALPSAVQDLARFFLNLAGSSSRGAVGGVAGVAAPASGVGAHLCPPAPGGEAVTSCAATAVPAGVVGPPAVHGSSGCQEVSRSSDGTCRAMKKRHRGVLLPLVVLLAAGRSPIGLLRSLPKMTEPRVLLPCLDVRLEVLLAILAPLQRVTARLVLSLWAGRRGRPRERSGIAQVLVVVCPPRLQTWRTMTVPVPLMQWTLTGMTPVCPGPHPELPQHGRAGRYPISSMQDFSCIDLWVDVRDFSGIPPAYLSLDAVASGRH